MKICIRKKIIICVIMALVFSCAFSLPAFAQERYIFRTEDLSLVANYSIENDLDNGSQSLLYTGKSAIGSISFNKYSNCPFNITSPSVTAQNYSLSVLVDGVNVSLTSSSVMWNILTRVAIGNGTSIYNMPNSFKIYLCSNDGVRLQELQYVEKGNVAYINDNFLVTYSGTYKFELFFGFGDLWSDVSADSWSNATYLYLYNFVFTRADDISDIGQQITDSITSSTNLIINAGNDKNTEANANAENELNNIKADEDDLISQMDNVFNQLPDISVFENEVIGVTTTGNILLAVFNGFGDKFIHLWWILSTIGILATFIGLLIKRKRE